MPKSFEDLWKEMEFEARQLEFANLQLRLFPFKTCMEAAWAAGFNEGWKYANELAKPLIEFALKKNL
jgi:hypothetical protein